MEPTIYKPGAYKTPGIYKGAGGIYKGRGVYKDGAGQIDPNLIYEFNLSRFNLDTLKDGHVQWYNYNAYTPANPIVLQKIDDFLRLNFTNGVKQFFAIKPNELNLYSDNFSSEFEYGGQYPYMSYCALMGGASMQANGGHTNTLWTMINNSWGRRIGFSITGKVNIKCYFVKQKNYFDVYLYVNGSFLGITQSSGNFNGDDYEGTNVDYNGSSNPGYIDMYKMILRRENPPG